MDYIDEHFMNSDAPQEDKELYLQVQAIVNSFMAKILADPICDRPAVYEEMQAKVMAFLQGHGHNMRDIPPRKVDEDEEFLHSGIKDKAVFLELKAIVQPFLDRAKANQGDLTSIDAEMRAAVMPFLKKTQPWTSIGGTFAP